MAALYMRPYPDLAAVLLVVTGAPGGPITITRTDDNGTREVRLLPDQEPIGGQLTIYDYEAALTGPISYTVTATSGLPTTETLPDGLGGDRVLLSTPFEPGRRHSPLLVLAYSEDHAGATVTHEILDAPEQPISILRPAYAPTGTVILLEPDYAAARNSIELLTRGLIVFLRQPTYPGMDRYFIVNRASLAPDPEDVHPRRWQVSADIRALPWPAGPLAGAAGWDFAALAASAPTFADATAPFDDFAALTIGP